MVRSTLLEGNRDKPTVLSGIQTFTNNSVCYFLGCPGNSAFLIIFEGDVHCLCNPTQGEHDIYDRSHANTLPSSGTSA